MQQKKLSQMNKEGILKYVENTQSGGGERQRIINEKDETLGKDKTYIESGINHETEFIIIYGRVNKNGAFKFLFCTSSQWSFLTFVKNSQQNFV